jgi:murein DD-endopeptidase MepM/ murein hydrolase activator NlpD
MRRPFLPAVAAAVVAVSLVACQLAAEAPVSPVGLKRTTDIELPSDADLIVGIVPARATLADLLADYRVLDEDRLALVDAVAVVFDVRRVRAGQPFTLDRLLDGRVRAFEYEIDLDRRVVVRAEARDRRVFTATIEPIEKFTTLVAVEGEINRRQPSLTQALDAAGERIDLALALADIFSGEVDFTSELQPGDRFRLLVERHTREGTFAGYGAIMAAELVTSGRPIQAFRYASAAGPAYFDGGGASLKRFFLKSPLKFEPRVTSRFSRARRHPILAYTRAHNGVDYQAPAGAPVAAVAPGVVTMAGWTGGGGRTVRIRHTNGYESEYLHLSAMAVRAGARVGQGDLVGRVGATGLATGPHLHYGLRKNGAYVNPVIEHRNMPPGEPVASAELTAFMLERDRLSRLFTTVRPRAAN